MREPLRAAYRAMPEPRRLIALGDCTLGRDILAGALSKIVGPIESLLPVDLRISGCPQSPQRSHTLTELHDADARPSGHAY